MMEQEVEKKEKKKEAGFFFCPQWTYSADMLGKVNYKRPWLMC